MGKKKKSILRKIVFWTIIVLLIAALVLTLIDMNDSNLIVSGEPKMIEILDECSLLMGNIFHPIKTKEVCKIKCDSECEIREMEFYDFEFTLKEGACNICNCYCK